MACDFDTICGHEAAHVVMRWIQGMPIAAVEVSEEGGIAHGTGKACDTVGYLLFTLAGFAYESGCGLSTVCLEKSSGRDFDDARELLERHLFLRFHTTGEPPEAVVQDVEQALSRWFDMTCEELFPHATLVEMIAESLLARRKLSAKDVRAIIKEYVRSDE